MAKIEINKILRFFNSVNSPLQELADPLFSSKGLQVLVKREDLLDSGISGNKFRKLHYNLVLAAKEEQSGLLTFAGAYSNHLAAVAAAGYRFGFTMHAVIRGEEPKHWSPTLQYAQKLGVHLHFVSRSEYRERDKIAYQEAWSQRVGGAYVIPEGGSNCLALKGVAAMVDEKLQQLAPDYIAVASGTGGTAAGIISNEKLHAKVISFPVLKGGFMKKAISDLLNSCHCGAGKSFEVMEGYHFGGYAKVPEPLMEFIHDFEKKFSFQLDPVYTSKMFYGIFDMAAKDYFPRGTTVLLVHTGGLQGRAGFTSLPVPPSIFEAPQ